MSQSESLSSCVGSGVKVEHMLAKIESPHALGS